MMTNSWMEVLSPAAAARFPNSNWLLDQGMGGKWTEHENKLFEDALAAFIDKDTPDRWEKVAHMIPGKTVDDVLAHYRDLEEDVEHIEAGLIPFPGYSSTFTFDWESNNGNGNGNCHGEGGFESGFKQAYCVGMKRSGFRQSSEQHERKKGVPWTEEEHRQFLMGLKKYGKGDWRNISRNFVVSRTPTQVASHAQKYFIRLNSGSKDKRRSSIHDITTVDMSDNHRPPSPSQPSAVSVQSSSTTTHISDQFSPLLDSNKHSEGGASVYNNSTSAHANQFMQPTYGIGMNPYGSMKMHSQHLHRGGLDSMVGHHSMMFHMNSVAPHPHG